jgi:uncharacterized C2H2 Zn-finger protein
MEQVVKRKRSPKIVSNEIESGPDKKRKVSPEEPVGDADIGKLNHVAELDAKDKSKKRRPVTRSRSSKTTKDLKEDDSVGDQPSESVCDDTEQDKEPVSNEGTDTAQIKEVQPSIGTSSELTLQSQVENTIEDVIVDSVQDTPKSPQLEVFRRSSVCSAGSQGDIASPKLKISPLSGGSPVAPAFSPSISPTTRSPLEQEPLYGQRPTNVLSPKGSAASDDSKGSVLEGDNVAPSQFDRMLTDVRKITERHQNSLEKSGKSPILTVGAALSSMSSLSQKFSVTSPPPPPLERGNSMEQTSDQGCKTKSTGRYPHDRSSSLPPSISSSPPNVLQHQGPQTTPTSPTGFPMTATSPPLALTKPVRKPSTESSETLPTMPKSPEPSKEKSTPVDTSSFSIPLNQGPSMAAQSASYFLTGTPPVQGLEFRSQPPTTPHTQVFAFYPSDTLIRPKTSSEEAQANIVTHTQQNAITTPSVTAPPNTNTPPPPPLISTHKSMFPVGESPASSTSAGIHPVVMPQIHASISAGKQYSQYPTIPQDQMHLPMYSLVHVHPHHPVHTQHPLTHGMRAVHPELVYRTWGYRGDGSSYPAPGTERTVSSSQTTSSPDVQPPKEAPKQVSRSVDHVSGKSSEEQNEFRCTQCGKYFKNKKALNGHMRKHGGAHGHKTVIKKEPLDASEYSDGEAGRFSQAYHERRSYQHRRTQQSPRFTFPTGNSMDVLLEVAEQARQKEEEERQKRVVADVLAHGVGSTPRKRPENISIPEYDHSGKRLKSMSPPPVMSPRPSILNMLSPRSSQPSTPGILKTRQSFDRDEEPPMIHVGDEYQAEVDDFCEGIGDVDEVEDPVQSDLMWKPIQDVSDQEDVLVDWFLEFACSDAIPYKGRNKELAMHTLYLMNYNIKEAMRALVLGKSVHEDSCDYRYPGTSEWKSVESKLFRRGFREYKKKFSYTLKTLSNKTLKELHEYYYTWKKLKPAEYRGRQRHHSDDEELAYLASWDCNGPEDAFIEEGPHSPTSSVESDFSKSTSLSDGESIDSHNKRGKVYRPPVTEKRSTPDLTVGARQPYEKSWAPLQQKVGGSLLGEGKFPFESPGKSTKVSSLAKETKSGHSSGNSDSPKRQKINTKTADDRPGNYPCGFCGITFPSIKSRSAHMKKHKYEDTTASGLNAGNTKK